MSSLTETSPVARRLIGRLVAAVAVVVLAPLAWSYGHALTKPGSDGVGIRTVEWFRDHHASMLVAWAEKEWYAHHAPPKGGVPKKLPGRRP